MHVLTLLVTILLTRECYGICDKRVSDGGCCYPSAPESELPTKCPLPDFWQGDTVGWSVDLSGHLELTFALPSVDCNLTCISVQLLVDESVSEEECAAKNIEMAHGRNGNVPVTEEKHSRKEFSLNNVCNGNRTLQHCEATGQLNFNFVFSGCYQVAFQPKASLSTLRKTYSAWKYLHTNYIKKLIAGHSHTNFSWITVTDQYYPALRKLLITFSIEHPSRRYGMHLNKYRWVAYCNNTACECFPSTKLPSKRPPADCTVSNGSISCNFGEVDPGDYCFTMEVTDDRCASDSLWTRPGNNLGCPQEDPGCTLTCNWQYNFTAAGKKIGLVLPESDSSKFYIILATVLAIVVVGTTVFLFVLKTYAKRYFQRTTPRGVPSCTIQMEQSRIFLLYARDCQPFMELMATLRELLEGATKSEVIDCLDPSRWNDIGRSPVEWVRSHIEHPNTKVMLVATPCGHLRQKAHLNQTVTYYRTPETYDNLFTYGLKTLTDNLSQDIYRKICVVRFEGFCDDGNLFSHLTPYTRFVLPLHLHQLISTLQPSLTVEEDGHLVENKEVQKLCQDLTNLINYKNTNINYLQDMLIVQRNETT